MYLWSQHSGRIEQTLWSCFNISRPPGHTDSWHTIRLRAVERSDSSQSNAAARCTMGSNLTLLYFPGFLVPVSVCCFFFFVGQMEGGGGRTAVEKEAERRTAKWTLQAASCEPVTSVLGASWQSLPNLSSAALTEKSAHMWCRWWLLQSGHFHPSVVHFESHISQENFLQTGTMAKSKVGCCLELSHYFLLNVLWLRLPLSVTWLCPKVSRI